jgi:hypothetical protein
MAGSLFGGDLLFGGNGLPVHGRRWIVGGAGALVKGVGFFGHQGRLNILGPGAPADCATGFLGEIFF